MKNFLWKTVPLLAVALSLGAQEPEFAAKEKVRSAKPAPACGVVENDQCPTRVTPAMNGGSLDFEVLYWRAENQGFYSAWKQTNPITAVTGATNVRTSSTSIVRPEADWDVGFRVGAGWDTAHDQWDICAAWTWYKNHSTNASQVSDTGTGVGLYPVRSGLLSAWDVVGPYLSNKSSWKLWQNVLDLELARSYYLTKKISMRTHMGVRGAVLKQKFHSTFETVGTPDAALGGMVPPPSQEIRQKNKFWGAGPRFAADADWHLGRGVSIVGRGGGSLLFGQQKWHSEDLVPGAGTESEKAAKSGEMYQTLVPNLQLYLGLQWGGFFSCDQYYVGVDAGWEANYWWNQYAVASMTNNVMTGNPVTTEGVTIRLHFDF